MRSPQPSALGPLDLIAQDRRKGNGPTGEDRKAPPRRSPLREHVSHVYVGPRAPEGLVSLLLAALMPRTKPR